MNLNTILLLAIPAAIIELILMAVAIVTVAKKTKTKYMNKTAWILIIIFVSWIGSICALIIEGGQDEYDSD